jgi:anti-sigma factor RsiW
MTCKEVLDFLMDYLDGTMPFRQRRDFERHLAVCPSCVAYLDSYKKTVKLGKAALASTDDPATSTVPEGLITAIRAAVKGK